MSGKPLEDRERLDQHLRAELRLPLEVFVGELPKEPHELAYAAELRKEGSVRVVSHEDAHALQHSQLAVPGLKALPICLREEPLLHQQLEYHAEALARMLEGRAAAEVVPLAVLQEKIVELLLFVSRRLSQQLAEEGGHCEGTRRADVFPSCAGRRRARPPAQLNYSTNYELQYELRTRTTYYELRTRTTYYELRTTYVLRTTLYYDYSPGSNLRDAANSPVAHGGSSNSDGLASLSKGACEAKIPQ